LTKAHRMDRDRCDIYAVGPPVRDDGRCLPPLDPGVFRGPPDHTPPPDNGHLRTRLRHMAHQATVTSRALPRKTTPLAMGTSARPGTDRSNGPELPPGNIQGRKGDPRQTSGEISRVSTFSTPPIMSLDAS
jgi:hypothetical protein